SPLLLRIEPQFFVPRCTVYFFLIAQIAVVFIGHRPALAGINLVNAISLIAIVAPWQKIKPRRGCSFDGSEPVDLHRLVAGLPGSGTSGANSGGSPHDAIPPLGSVGSNVYASGSNVNTS